MEPNLQDNLVRQLNLRLINRINDNITVVLGVIENVLLLFLILKKTPKEMRIYRKILLQNCIVDIIYTIGTAIAEPLVVFKKGHELIILNGYLRDVPLGWNSAFLDFWLFGLTFTMTSISVQFIYRYLVLVKSIKISRLIFTALLAVPFSLTIIHVAITGYLYYPTPEKIAIANAEFGMYFIEGNMNHTGAGLIGLSDRWDVYVIGFDLLVLAGGGYGIVIWCSIKILFHLRNKTNQLTLRVRQQHSQLNKALFAQAIGPLVVCVVPMLTAVYVIITKADAVVLTITLFFSLVWIPVVNPLLTIWFVTPYRRAVLKFKLKISARIHTHEIEQNIVQHPTI